MPNNDDHPFVLTLFDNQRAAYGELWNITWGEFCDLEHHVRAEKDGNAFTAATYRDNRRAKRRMIDCHGLGLDIDSKNEDDILAALERIAHLEYLIWSTHSHDPDLKNKPKDPDKAKLYKPQRVRIVVPFAEPVSLYRAEKAWHTLNDRMLKIVDKQTKDATRLHYLPSCPASTKKHAFVIRNEGRLFMPRAVEEKERKTTWEISDFEAAAQADKLRSWLHRLNKGAAIKEPAKRLANGEVIADEGERHNTMLALTWNLALRWDNLAEKTIRELFGPSLAQDPDGPTTDEAWTAYLSACEKVLEGNLIEKERKAEEALHDQAEAAGFEGSYTEDHLARIAQANGWGVEELVDRWLIQYKGIVFLLDGDGNYRGPFSKDDAGVAASRVLARAPVRMVERTQAGDLRYRAVVDYAREAGQVASKIITDLTAQTPRFDPHTGIFYEATTPVRAIRPAQDQELDKWLRLLAGDVYEVLLDWLACASDLTKLLCALYFHGPRGSGKTLLAYGLARLWTEGPPADAEMALSGFNEEMVRCPMILADEELPSHWGKDTVTTKLRSMLSVYSRSLRRLYTPPTEMEGAVRFIIAANNPSLLSHKGVITQQDLEAIAERFLYLNVSRKSTKYLETIPIDVKEHWAREGIAAYSLWLRENRHVEPPSRRFWVQGDITSMHRLLITGSHWNSLVCEWFVRFLMQPEKLTAGRAQTRPLVFVADGKLYCSVQGVVDGWDTYLEKAREPPRTDKIGHAIRSLATGEQKRLRAGPKNVQTRFQRIDPEHLKSWAFDNGIADGDSIAKALETNTAEIKDTATKKKRRPKRRV